MKIKTENQHITPRYRFKKFCINNKFDIFFKNGKYAGRSGPGRNIACEKNIYEPNYEGEYGENELEIFFSKEEREQKILVEKLISIVDNYKSFNILKYDKDLILEINKFFSISTLRNDFFIRGFLKEKNKLEIFRNIEEKLPFETNNFEIRYIPDNLKCNFFISDRGFSLFFSKENHNIYLNIVIPLNPQICIVKKIGFYFQDCEADNILIKKCDDDYVKRINVMSILMCNKKIGIFPTNPSIDLKKYFSECEINFFYGIENKSDEFYFLINILKFLDLDGNNKNEEIFYPNSNKYYDDVKYITDYCGLDISLLHINNYDKKCIFFKIYFRSINYIEIFNNFIRNKYQEIGYDFDTTFPFKYYFFSIINNIVSSRKIIDYKTHDNHYSIPDCILSKKFLSEFIDLISITEFSFEKILKIKDDDITLNMILLESNNLLTSNVYVYYDEHGAKNVNNMFSSNNSLIINVSSNIYLIKEFVDFDKEESSVIFI